MSIQCESSIIMIIIGSNVREGEGLAQLQAISSQSKEWVGGWAEWLQFTTATCNSTFTDKGALRNQKVFNVL